MHLLLSLLTLTLWSWVWLGLAIVAGESRIIMSVDGYGNGLRQKA